MTGSGLQWTTREKLHFVAYLERNSHCYDWGGVAKFMSKNSRSDEKHKRPADFFTTKSCAAQFEEMTKTSTEQQQQRNSRRGAGGMGPDSMRQLVVQYTTELFDENKRLKQKQFEKYENIRNELESLASGQLDFDQIQSMCDQARQEDREAGLSDDDPDFKQLRQKLSEIQWEGETGLWLAITSTAIKPSNPPEKASSPVEIKIKTPTVAISKRKKPEKDLTVAENKRKVSLTEGEKDIVEVIDEDVPLAALVSSQTDKSPKTEKPLRISPRKSAAAQSTGKSDEKEGHHKRHRHSHEHRKRRKSSTETIKSVTNSQQQQKQDRSPPLRSFSSSSTTTSSTSTTSTTTTWTTELISSPNDSQSNVLKLRSTAFSGGQQNIRSHKKSGGGGNKLGRDDEALPISPRISSRKAVQAISSSVKMDETESSDEASESAALEYKQWKTMILQAWREISSHRHAGIFAQAVSDRDAKFYSKAVKHPMDLGRLKKQVENGEVRDTDQFKRHLLLMFANAVMYNSTGHDVNIYAKEMAADTVAILNEIMDPSRPSAGDAARHRRSRLMDTGQHSLRST